MKDYVGYYEHAPGGQISSAEVLGYRFRVDKVTRAGPTIWHEPVVLQGDEPEHHKNVSEEHVWFHYLEHPVFRLQVVHKCRE